MIVLINKDKLLEGYLEKFLTFDLASNENVAIIKYPNARVVIACDAEPESISALVDAGFAVLAIDHIPSYDRGCELLGAGARGYGNANMCERHYQDAISSIKNGGMWVLPEVMAMVIARISHNTPARIKSLPDLARREEVIAQMVCNGMTNQSIASELGLSLRTIKGICAELYKKAQANNRMDFVLKIGGPELADRLANRKRKSPNRY